MSLLNYGITGTKSLAFDGQDIKTPDGKDLLQGVVTRVYSQKTDWAAGRIKSKADGIEYSFAGSVFAENGKSITLVGEWTIHPTYGKQFSASGMQEDLKPDREGIISFLANHPQIPGVGPAKAAKIADVTGDSFGEFLLSHPEIIAKAANIPMETVLRFQEAWRSSEETNQVAMWLSGYGITYNQSKVLAERYGASCRALLTANPYLIIREIPRMGFKKVDKIARQMGVAKENPNRIRAGLTWCVSEEMNAGHCWTEFDELLSVGNNALVMDVLNSRELIADELDGMISEGTLACLNVEGRGLVASKNTLYEEMDIAEFLRNGLERNPHFRGASETDIYDMIDKVEAGGDVFLNDEQREAVFRALTKSVSVISGGAGTGKSFTASTILEICQNRALTVEVTAPTGKAARRMAEISGGKTEGKTIHRLLKYDGQSFGVNASAPLEEVDVLIVDEFSMVDVPLAWALFEAVDLTKTAVVLLGDHNQLPPVGVGNLLRDIVAEKPVPVTELVKVMRQEDVALREGCLGILRGDVAGTSEDRGWCVASGLQKEESVVSTIVALFENRLETMNPDVIKNILLDVQVLSPQKSGAIGTEQLNIGLQRLLQKKLWGVDVPPLKGKQRPKLLLHDKVIQMRNDYELGVMNGTIGIVAGFPNGGKRGDVVVRFGEGDNSFPVTFSEEKQRDLQLAYALTIHKSQGSEFPCVIVVIHKSHSFMHHRNLFYTGVTRARKHAIVLGDGWGIRNCAKKKQSDKRRTFLPILLRDPEIVAKANRRGKSGLFNMALGE